MLTILKTGQSAHKVPTGKVRATYGHYRIQALLSVCRISRFTIWSKQFHIIDALFKETVDLQRYAKSTHRYGWRNLVTYGISKEGVIMSSLADKASPKSSCGVRSAVLCAIVLLLG